MTNHAVVLAIYIITFLIGLPTNLLSLYTFLVKAHKDPNPGCILLLNLAFADFMLLLFLPLKMVEATHRSDWPFPNVLCIIITCIFDSSIYISTLLLTAISVHRLLGIAFPFKYRLKQKSAYTVVASAFIWLLVGSHCSSFYIARSMSTNANETFQLSSSPAVILKEFDEQKMIVYPFWLGTFIVFYCIPFVITFSCHISVICLLVSPPGFQDRCKQRCKGLAVVTWLIFVICFGPYNVFHILGALNYADTKWSNYSLALSSFNICLDPFVFFFASNAIRKNAGIWYRRFQHITAQCSVPHYKNPRDNGEGAEAIRLSASNALEETSVGKISSSVHPSKNRDVSTLNPR